MTCTSLFNAALFVLAKDYNQLKCYQQRTEESLNYGTFIQGNTKQPLQRINSLCTVIAQSLGTIK